jgi:hypothetical protein
MHGSPIAASRLPSFQSQTRTVTVVERFPVLTGKANSVSPVPARIALQGGERADTDAICPCPLQEKSDSGSLLGRLTTPNHGDQYRQPKLGHTIPLRFLHYDTRRIAFLRNLLTITRNRGGVNDFHPTLQGISRFIRSIAAPRLRPCKQNQPVAWYSACCRGYGQSSAAGRAHRPGSQPR